MTTHRPTWTSTLEKYDFTPELYRHWTDAALRDAVANYEKWLETGDSDIELAQRRLAQLRRELARREKPNIDWLR